VCVCVVLLKVHGGTHCERETKSIGYGMCLACTRISCHNKKRNDRARLLDHNRIWPSCCSREASKSWLTRLFWLYLAVGKKRSGRAVLLDHDEGGLRVESTKPVGAG